MPKPAMEGHATMKCPIDFMACKLFYLIILMICVLEGKGMHWILCRIVGVSPFGVWSPYTGSKPSRGPYWHL